MRSLLQLLLLALLSKELSAWGNQHYTDTVCFDLEGNGGDDLSAEDSGCTFYIWNDGWVVSETGIGNYNTNDCIRMSNPKNDQYTYVWTTCSDALWVDQFHISTNNEDCGSEWSDGYRNTNRKCGTYGADNQKGWCLSTDRNDHVGWESYVPDQTCFGTIILGKPALLDTNVYGFHWYPGHYHTGHYGRRSLKQKVVEAEVANVKACEADPKSNQSVCNGLAAKVMQRIVDEAEAHQEDWVVTNLRLHEPQKKSGSADTVTKESPQNGSGSTEAKVETETTEAEAQVETDTTGAQGNSE